MHSGKGVGMGEATARGTLSMHGAISLLIGAVLVPTVLSISVGIVALALWKDASDIVLGVLTISFAAMVIGGAVGTLVLLRKYNRLARLQADFMANISHELNTPLTAIRMFAETLRYGRVKSTEDVKRCLVALSEETERLSGYIERILRWRRMEAGASTYFRRPERIEDVVGDALRPLAA
ncbi:MAG: sensor histidine kinase, partial [Deltaproteobacteria bacterium]|nr:sensor histidine kinase [Deltaproteobacteria bacterium]